MNKRPITDQFSSLAESECALVSSRISTLDSQNSGGCKKLHLMAGYLDTSVFGMKGMANLQLAASNAKTPMWHL